MKIMNNGVIYARYSSSSQDEQTIEMQLKKCHEYAQANNINVIKEYVDEAKTGRNGNRDGLQEILKDSKTKSFKYVIIYMTDRFFRNALEALKFKDELKNNGVTLLYTYEKFDNSPFGKYMEIMSYANAQLYSDMYAIKITDGLARNAREFKTIGNNVPYGFKAINKEIVIDEEKAPYVRMIFEMYTNGSTIKNIYEHLNQLGVKNKRGRAFNKNNIARILQNKFYIGTYVFKSKETPNVIPRIIDDEIFISTQKLLKKHKEAPARSRAKTEYLLTGKLFCGYCGEKLIGYSGTSKMKQLFTYYKCKNAVKEKNCKQKIISKDYLENLVFKEVKKVLNDDIINAIIKEIVALCDKDRDTYQLKIINKAIKDNQKKNDNLVEAIAECDDVNIRKQLYLKLEEINNQRIELDKQLSEEEKKHIKITAKEIKFFLKGIKKSKEDDFESKKKVINTFVNKVILYEDHVTIVLNIQNSPIDVDIDTINHAKSSFKGTDSPPYENYTNTIYPILGGFVIEIRRKH